MEKRCSEERREERKSDRRDVNTLRKNIKGIKVKEISKRTAEIEIRHNGVK